MFRFDSDIIPSSFDFYDQNDVLIAIRKIEKWLINNDYFIDVSLSFSSLDKVYQRFLVHSSNKINPFLSYNLFSNYQEVKNLFFNDIKKIQSKDVSDKEEQILIQELKQQIQKNIVLKKEIQQEYLRNYKLIIEDTNSHLNKNQTLVQKIQKSQIQNKQQLLVQKENYYHIAQKKKEIIRQNFHQQNVLLNNKIKQINLLHQNNLDKLHNIYQKNTQKIITGQAKIKTNFLIQTRKIEIFFQKKLKQHHQILEKEQIEFLQSKKFLDTKMNSFFQQNKLLIFFFIQKVSKNHFQNFYLLMKETRQKFFLYLKKLHLWRKEYIKMFVHNNELNDKLLEQQKIQIKILALAKENNIFWYQKEQEMMHIDKNKQMHILEQQLKNFEIQKKYKIMVTELNEEQKKNQIEIQQLRVQYQTTLQLCDLNYKKENILCSKEIKQKKVLLQKQFKLEIIKFKQESLQNVITYCKEIIKLKTDLANLKCEKEKKIKVQQKILENKKKIFLQRTNSIKNQIQLDIDSYYEFYSQYLFNLQKIINELVTIHNKQKEIIKNIQFYFSKLLVSYLSMDDYYLFASNNVIDALYNCVTIFYDKFQDKQFDYHFLLQEKIHIFQECILEQKINFYYLISKYFETNMNLVNEHLNKIKSKYETKQNYNYGEFDNQIKIYENFNVYFKKKLSVLQKYKLKQKKYKEKKNKNLKNKQIKMLLKYNKLQTKMFVINSRIAYYKKNPNTTLSKIALWFWKKNFLSCWNAICKNFISYGEQLISPYNTTLIKIQKFLDMYVIKMKEQFKNKTNKIIQQHFCFISSFMETIHHLELNNIFHYYKKTKNNINTNINLIRTKINKEISKINQQKNLIKENFNDVLAELELESRQKIYKNTIKQKQENSRLKKQFKKQQEFLNTIHSALTKQQTILAIYQKNEEQKNLFFSRTITDQYEKKYLILIKKIKQKQNKTILSTNYIKYKNYFKSYISKMSWFYKLTKEKWKIYQKHLSNIRKLNQSIDAQIFWYKKFYFLWAE
ncbi:MAG: hypothetical protein Q8784_00345 [Vigna little leaf phytoplasma]|nr:hypothetical protein [Vigna little leaf phytoplasma]